jgi:hypothetical protein
MKEDPSQEQSLKEWADLFSDPASSLSTLGKGNLSEPTFSASLYLALLSDLFLSAGEEPVKEKWASLPQEMQTDLGIELLKDYLFQPLYIRLSKEKKLSPIKSPLKLESQGKFFRVEHGAGPNRKIELLYPLNHHRFWPDLFRLFEEDFFSSEKVFKALEPGILLASSSRLEKIRRRAENLSTLFLKGKQEEISASLPPGDQSEIKNAQEDTSGPEHGDVHPPEKTEPDLSAPAISDLPPSPPSPPKRKKKKKPSDDQLELF